MRLSGWTVSRLVRLFLLAAFPIVHCFGPTFPALSQPAPAKSAAPRKQQQPASPTPRVGYGAEALPGPVQDMREAILSAVRSGRIEELRHAWELSEPKPDLGVDLAGGDPVAHWKAISGDGEGREVLAALAEALDAGYVAVPAGRDLENNRVYVWPYFAEVALGKLTAAQEVELLRLVAPAAARQMRSTGKYTHWRVSIGADGAWHSFRRGG